MSFCLRGSIHILRQSVMQFLYITFLTDCTTRGCTYWNIRIGNVIAFIHIFPLNSSQHIFHGSFDKTTCTWVRPHHVEVHVYSPIPRFGSIASLFSSSLNLHITQIIDTQVTTTRICDILSKNDVTGILGRKYVHMYIVTLEKFSLELLNWMVVQQGINLVYLTSIVCYTCHIIIYMFVYTSILVCIPFTCTVCHKLCYVTIDNVHA